MLHNPLGSRQRTQKFRLSKVLELPEASSLLRLEVKTVKSAARLSEPWSSRAVGYPKHGPDCDKHEKCMISASSELVVEMLPAEVLVLEVTGIPAHADQLALS